jgi:hypothetical protein
MRLSIDCLPCLINQAVRMAKIHLEQYFDSEIFLLLSMTLKEMRFYLKGIFRTIRAFILTYIRSSAQRTTETKKLSMMT